MAAQLVLDLQTIVSREIKPIEPASITVGSIHGGTKHNIIGNECHLQLTVRSYSDEVRQQLLDGDRPQGQGRRRRRRRAGAEGRRSPKARRPCSTTRSWPTRLREVFVTRIRARTTSMTPSRAWAARTSASTAGPACRS